MQIEESAKVIIVSGGRRNEFLISEFSERIRAIQKYLKVITEFITNSIQMFLEKIKSLQQSTYDFVEIIERRKKERNLYKLDFTRKKIVHQVMCRKPKYLVKKIIR